MEIKLIKSFLDLKQNKICLLEYPMKNDCIRIFESLSAKGMIHVFQGMENLMTPVCVLYLKENYINTISYLNANKNIKYIINLFLFSQIIKGMNNGINIF